MNRRMSVIVLLVLLCAGCQKIESKHHEMQKVASLDHHDAAQHDCAACHSLSNAEAETLLKNFGEVKDVKLAPVKGLYEVTLQQGGQQMAAYIDFGKKRILSGRLFDITTRKLLTPLPKKVPVKLSKAQLEQIKLEDSILMGNLNGKKRMFVFADPDCPYCKRLHDELKKLVPMEPDLAISIKIYPLKMHRNAYDKARVILAAKSLDMLDKAFAGEKLPSPGEKDPKKPVDETIKIAKSLGIEGTPALVLPDGQLVMGFQEAEKIHEMLAPTTKRAAE